MNWNRRQLHAFVEICRLQSFSRAAEQIAISQSGISMLIKELEAQVGARLFDRTTRAVTLTDAARTLHAVAVRVLADLDAVTGQIAGTEQARASRLSVAATPMICANLLPPVIRRFAARHEGVQVQVADVDIVGVRERVLGGESDIGLGFFIKPAVNMRRTPLLKFRLMCVSPQGTGLGASRTWKSLGALPLLSLPAFNPIQSLIEEHLGAIGRAHEERPTMNLIGTIIAMVEAGLGHAVLPSFAMPECLRHQIGIAMLTEPAVSIDLMVASRTGTRLSPMASDFVAELHGADYRSGR